MNWHRLPISAIVLTYNEELNLPACLESLQGWVSEVYAVGSGSTEGTAQIAPPYSTKLVTHPWRNYATQFNWTLDNLPLPGEWVLRLDADETVTPELVEELRLRLPCLPSTVTGLYVKRRVYFMGRWMRHGGSIP